MRPIYVGTTVEPYDSLLAVFVVDVDDANAPLAVIDLRELFHSRVGIADIAALALVHAIEHGVHQLQEVVHVAVVRHLHATRVEERRECVVKRTGQFGGILDAHQVRSGRNSPDVLHEFPDGTQRRHGPVDCVVEGEGRRVRGRAGEEQRLVVDLDGHEVRLAGAHCLNRGIQLDERGEEVICLACLASGHPHHKANRVVVSHGFDGARSQQGGIQVLQ